MVSSSCGSEPWWKGKSLGHRRSRSWVFIIQWKSVLCPVNPTEIEQKWKFPKVSHLQSPKVKSTLLSTNDLKCALYQLSGKFCGSHDHYIVSIKLKFVVLLKIVLQKLCSKSCAPKTGAPEMWRSWIVLMSPKHCKVKVGVRSSLSALHSLLPRLHFFLPFPPFALQCIPHWVVSHDPPTYKFLKIVCHITYPKRDHGWCFIQHK